MDMVTPIPPAFLERMRRHLGEEFDDFRESMGAEPTSALRVNTLKIEWEEYRKISPFPLKETVPWAEGAFILERGEGSPGLHPHHQAGLYYLQEPSAMAPAALLRPRPGEKVLDLAAAPGGKTTYLASLMRGKGLLVANEIKEKRVGHLAMNMERWGAGNVAITNETPERLADHFGAYFDAVLVDAPCSGEGMFRKDMGARADWSQEMVSGCAARQRNILRIAAKMVRPGGRLMYSTCTFAVEENESVLADMMSEVNLNGQGGEFQVVPLPQYPGFMPGRPDWIGKEGQREGRNEELKGAARLFPHRLTGEGHFVCLMEKGGGNHEALPGGDRLMGPRREEMSLWQEFLDENLVHSLPTDRLRLKGERLYLIPDDMPNLAGLRSVHPGTWLGNFKKKRFEPAHPLALTLQAKESRNSIDLRPNDPTLAKYMHGEPFQHGGRAGWTLLCVDGFGIGWGKRVGDVVKNHYPRGWIQGNLRMTA